MHTSLGYFLVCLKRLLCGVGFDRIQQPALECVAIQGITA